MLASMIVSFLPWVILAILPTHTLLQLNIVLGIALLLTILLNRKELRRWFVIPWASLIFFLVNLVLLLVFHVVWPAENMNLLVPGYLGIIVWFSLLIGQPFTIQYAKLQVAKEKWKSPEFIFVSRVLTSAWGIIFLINFTINILAPHFSIDSVFIKSATDITTIFGVWLTIWYPKYYRKHKKRS